MLWDWLSSSVLLGHHDLIVILHHFLLRHFIRSRFPCLWLSRPLRQYERSTSSSCSSATTSRSFVVNMVLRVLYFPIFFLCTTLFDHEAFSLKCFLFSLLLLFLLSFLRKLHNFFLLFNSLILLKHFRCLFFFWLFFFYNWSQYFRFVLFISCIESK